MDDITLSLEDQINIVTPVGRVNVFYSENGYLCVTIEDVTPATDLSVWVDTQEVF